MDHSTAAVPEPACRLAEGVWFQQMDRDSVLLNLKTDLYCELDPKGTRIRHLLTTTRTEAATIATMRTEYGVDIAMLHLDVTTLTERLTANGMHDVENSSTDKPRA